MDALETSLIIIISINLMLVLGQFSAMNVNPDFNMGQIIDCDRSPLGQYANTNCTSGHYSIDTNAPALPTSSTSVDTTTGGVFTDLWNTVKGFFGDTLGLKYLVAVVGAPKTFLTGMGLDPDFASLIGGMWWIINVILVISYIKR